MILAAYKDPYGKVDGGIYDTHEQYFRDTFSPECGIIDCIELKVKGKTYGDRKEYLEDLAKRYQIITSELSLSYGELIELGCFFDRNGRRYGLMEKFRENRIC
jgi:hypothetical protein